MDHLDISTTFFLDPVGKHPIMFYIEIVLEEMPWAIHKYVGKNQQYTAVK